MLIWKEVIGVIRNEGNRKDSTNHILRKTQANYSTGNTINKADDHV